MDTPAFALRAAASLAAHQDVEGAASELLRVALDLTGATGGATYLLSLAAGRYEPLTAAPGDRSRWPTVSTDDFEPRFRTDELTPHLAAERFLGKGWDGVAVLSFRQTSCLGALVLEGFDWAAAPKAVTEALRGAASLMVPVFERRFSADLLSSIQIPLDFTRSEPDFLDQIGDLIGLSAGMEFSALRELEDDGGLICRGFWSHGEESRPTGLDIEDPSQFEPFYSAAMGTTFPVPDVRDLPDLAPLMRRDGLEDVRSFVAVPVTVGTANWGVMSVAARCAFDYSKTELAGFASIANGVGVAWANYRSFHASSGRLGKMIKAGFAITALEVATNARHEAVNYLEEAQAKLLRVSQAVDGQTLAEVELASERIAEAARALLKIRAAADPPAQKLARVRLTEVFSDARSQVQGRLQKERIDCRYVGRDLELDAYPEYLASAIANLLFNSIDAFEGHKRRGRSIEFVVATPSPRDSHIRITYRDNGPGLQPQRLRIPDGSDVPRTPEAVFEPGVTTKDRGTGYGLWLVRRVITNHQGSIDLKDYRQGMVFELTLSRELAADG